MGHLGPTDAKVAEAFVRLGGDRAAIAAVTGTYPQHISRAIGKPHVLNEIARLELERLVTEGVPAAISCLVEIASNKRAPAGARVQASKVILDRAFAGDDATNERPLHEWTAAQISERIEQFERRALAARNITPEPEIQAVDVDPFG